MNYTAPSLTVPVLLSGAVYVSPDLHEPLLTCQDALGAVTGTLTINLGVNSPSLVPQISLEKLYGLTVTLPPPTLGLILSAQVAPVSPVKAVVSLGAPPSIATNCTAHLNVVGTVGLSVALPPPSTHALSMSAVGDAAHHVRASLTLPLPALDFLFRARERSIYVSMQVVVVPPALPLVPTVAVSNILPVRSVISMAPTLAPVATPEVSSFRTALAVFQDLNLPSDTPTLCRTLTGELVASCNGFEGYTQQAQGVATRNHQPTGQALPLGVGKEVAEQPTAKLERFSQLVEASTIQWRSSSATTQTGTVRTRVALGNSAQHGVKVLASTTYAEQEAIRLQQSWRGLHREFTPHAKSLWGPYDEAYRFWAGVVEGSTSMTWPLPGKWWPSYIAPTLYLSVPCKENYLPRPLHCKVFIHWAKVNQPYCPEVPDEEDEGGTIVVPVRRVYITMNDVRLFLADNMEELPVLSLSLDLDMDSWAWGFKASLPGECLSKVGATTTASPIELLARVNGVDYRVLAERVSRSRSFGKESISLSGRGHTAYLAAPFSTKTSFTNAEGLNAQQLLDQILTTNGVSMGWVIDWQMSDWFIPAGVWSVRGTYMDAVISVVTAPGGFLLPHPNQKTLHVHPRYPYPPWEWATATLDYEIPSSVAETESIEWSEKPAYNAVYVSGESEGVLAYVKRRGSEGNYMAPMVTDPLITHVDAARQRGIAELSDTGRIATVKLSLPVLPDTHVIEPGSLVKYVDGSNSYIGVAKSVEVAMSGQPILRQTIELEVHG